MTSKMNAIPLSGTEDGGLLCISGGDRGGEGVARQGPQGTALTAFNR